MSRAAAAALILLFALALTDVAASRIIRNVITPRFKEGDFDRGVEDGVQAIVAALEGQAPAARLCRNQPLRLAASATATSRGLCRSRR